LIKDELIVKNLKIRNPNLKYENEVETQNRVLVLSCELKCKVQLNESLEF